MTINYFTIPPPSALSDFVRFFWVLECEVPPNNFYVHRSMADGCAELIFHYRGQFDELFENGTMEKSFLSGIHGPSKFYRRFRIDQNFGIFGVYLYPYAMPALFGIPATELSDNMPDLISLWGHEGGDLQEQMMLAPDNHVRTEIATSFLLKKLRKSHIQDHPFYYAIKTIVKSNSQLKISDLAGDYCLSVRQFERKFKEFAGFSPKLYCRIVRFQSVFQEFDSGATLPEIAYNCGYYDQSHFIHDFRAFSGYNPKQFFSGNTSDTTIWSE